MATRAAPLPTPAWWAILAAAGAGAGVVTVAGEVVWLLVVVAVVGAGALLAGNVRLLLGLCMASVILGSGANPYLKDAFFYARFLLYGLAIVTLMITKKEVVKAHPVWVFAAGLGGLAALSVSWSHHPSLTVERSVGFALLLCLTFLLASTRWTSPKTIRDDFAVVAGVAGGAVVVSVGLFVWDRDLAYSHLAYGGGDRFTGVFENPNGAGLLIALFLPLALSLTSSARGFSRVGWYTSIALSILVLLLAESRGGLAGAAVGTIAFTALRSVAARGKQLALVVVASVVMIPMALLAASGSRGLSGGLERFREEGLQSGRFEAWSLAVDLWWQKPLTGWGFGAGDEVFAPLAAPLAQTNVFVGSNPHNSYLTTLIELGPLGVGALVAVMLIVLRQAVSYPRDDLRAGLLGALTAGVVISMVESGATAAGSMYAFMLWLVVAAIVSAHRRGSS